MKSHSNSIAFKRSVKAGLTLRQARQSRSKGPTEVGTGLYDEKTVVSIAAYRQT